MTIRPALPEEDAALSALAIRSKAAHGYGEEFMRQCTAELTVTRDLIAASDTFVAKGPDGRILGFCRLVCTPPLANLTHLFVEPDAWRTGVGQRLWQTAVSRANRQGASMIELDADPNAEGFYAAMGARRVGEVPSGSIPGRMLPHMVYPS